MTAESPPLVSVIIPTYNYAYYLGDAIWSVLNQTYSNFEVIVVDNFSTDGTLELVESIDDKRISLFQFENGGSIAAARNFGWRQASGSLVAFLDADDKWHQTKLEKQISLHSPISSSITHHDLRLFGSRNLGKTSGRNLREKALMDLLTRGNALSTSSVIVSKELLHASNGFSEDKAIISAEDFELWLRLADQGANFRFINKSLGSYRMHAQSNSSGKSARAAANVVAPYRSRLAPKELKRLDGWLAYAIAVDSSSRKVRIAHLSEAARLATFRFKWRAIIRLCSLR